MQADETPTQRLRQHLCDLGFAHAGLALEEERTTEGEREIDGGGEAAVGNVPAANLGPFPPVLISDWLSARLAGKPVTSERWFVQPTGQIVKTPLGAA